MPFRIIRNDITTMTVDAIVNAANTSLKAGGGVCGAIFHAAGADALQAECDRFGGCKVGEAVITNGYKLNARHIIHTVGPIWDGGLKNEAKLLRHCYLNSLLLALKYGVKSIAFPLISSGIYGYPKDQALQIAISAIGEFLLKHDMDVFLVVYDKKSFVLSEKLFSAIEKFIDDNYINEHRIFVQDRQLQSYDYQSSTCLNEYSEPVPESKRQLEDILLHLDDTFSQMLLRLIDDKGYTDVDTYKRANIDRKLFSKIRNTKSYNPSKVTAIAFAIALRLNLDETRDLLSKAGYMLSHSNKFDVIIEYFIEEGNYNIFEINEALFAFDQVLLGA